MLYLLLTCLLLLVKLPCNTGIKHISAITSFTQDLLHGRELKFEPELENPKPRWSIDMHSHHEAHRHGLLPSVCEPARNPKRPIRIFHAPTYRPHCSNIHRKLDVVQVWWGEAVAEVNSAQKRFAEHPNLASRQPCFIVVSKRYNAVDIFNRSHPLHMPLVDTVIEMPDVDRELPGGFVCTFN